MPQPMRELPNLDFLRSIAVVLVALSHLMLYTGHLDEIGWSGITGVCFFFVHTSLVLMWSLERDPHAGRFYIRRIFRIYPLWLAILFLTLAFRVPTAPFYVPQFRFFMPGLKELVENITLTCNLGKGARVVGASWTLPIEVQMYLLLPFLFAFARHARGIWPFLLVDAFAMVYAVRRNPPISSDLSVCIPYFLPGIMAYILLRRTRLQILPSWSFIPWILSLVAIAHHYGSFRQSWFVCLALGISLPLFRQITFRPLVRCSHIVARYSYGVYLTHFMAIAVAVHLMRSQPLASRAVAFLGTIAVLSVGFYHLLEAPMMRVGSRLARRIEPGPAPKVTAASMSLEPAP